MTDEERDVAMKHVARYVSKNDYVTFVEIGRQLEEIGIPIRGHVALMSAPNVLLWADMSEEFADVVQALQRARLIHMTGTGMLTYMIDGGGLNLPLAKRPPAAGYKDPHWLPVCFRPGARAS